jgi:P-type conjugative transfer protein TrbJ
MPALQWPGLSPPYTHAGAEYRLQRHDDRPGVRPGLSAELFGIDVQHATSGRCANALAGVVQNLQNAQTQISALVSSSQSASGALQAAQSGNQIIGLAAQQLADLTGVIAAMARAQSLDNAGRLESEAQGQQQMQNFLNYGAGYQPGNAQMFH